MCEKILPNKNLDPVLMWFVFLGKGVWKKEKEKEDKIRNDE